EELRRVSAELSTLSMAAGRCSDRVWRRVGLDVSGYAARPSRSSPRWSRLSRRSGPIQRLQKSYGLTHRQMDDKSRPLRLDTVVISLGSGGNLRLPMLRRHNRPELCPPEQPKSCWPLIARTIHRHMR